MIVDVRTYRVKPNKMPQELDLYEKHGLAPQVRHLGSPLAYLYGESGDINTLVHLWVFEDAADCLGRGRVLLCRISCGDLPRR